MHTPFFCKTLFIFYFLISLVNFNAYGNTELLSTPQAISAKIKNVQNPEDIKWRRATTVSDPNEIPWIAFSNQTEFLADTEIQTGSKGSLELQFIEGSELTMSSQTTLSLQSLHDPQHQPLIWINLIKGLIAIKIAPYTGYRSFSIFTPSAVIIPEIDFQKDHLHSEVLPLFSVLQDQSQDNGQSKALDLTTIVVNNGYVAIQFENPNHQSMQLTSNEQISFTESTVGPIVIAGAAPTLVEPKELKYRKLDLGSMEVCEMIEGNPTENCGFWRWNKEKQYFEAAWQNGGKSYITVEKMSGGEIILHCKDIEGPYKGRLATYIGHNQGTEIQGDVAIQILAGSVTWNYQGKITSGTWKARSNYLLNLDE